MKKLKLLIGFKFVIIFIISQTLSRYMSNVHKKIPVNNLTLLQSASYASDIFVSELFH